MTYKIIEINPENTTQTVIETLGTKRKHWIINENKQRALFKVGRPDTGENWAEKASCELAGLLGLPHAEYEFATFRDFKGVLSPSFVLKYEQLVHGNELLARFKIEQNEARYYKQHHHTIGRVKGAIKRIEVPRGTPNTKILLSGEDVFVGYMMLDAWIANQDRHDENWGIILTPISENGGRPLIDLRLAPTYDHASSLGRIETHERKKKRLEGRDPNLTVESYLAKSKSAFFHSQSDKKPLSTFDAFDEFTRGLTPATLFWLDRLLGIQGDAIRQVFERMPPSEMDEVSIEFALKMLEINKLQLERKWSSLK